MNIKHFVIYKSAPTRYTVKKHISTKGLISLKLIKRIFQFLLILLLLCGTAGFYAIKIEPYRLVVKTYPIGDTGTTNNTSKEKAADEITIVQVSDIQISPTYDEKQLKLLV